MDPKSVLEGMFSSVAEPRIGQLCGSLFQFFFSSKLQAEEQCNMVLLLKSFIPVIDINWLMWMFKQLKILDDEMNFDNGK